MGGLGGNHEPATSVTPELRPSPGVPVRVSSPVLLRWNHTSRRLHTMCFSCSRKENRRLYLFIQLSVTMMFSGQSTWREGERQRQRDRDRETERK